MDPNTQALLNQTLYSPVDATQTPGTVTVVNKLHVPIVLFHLDPAGTQWPLQDGDDPGVVYPQDESPFQFYTGVWYFARTLASGALVCLFQGAMAPTGPDQKLPSRIEITSDFLQPPNDIGVFPAPSTEILIPQNAPSVLVATGVLPNGNVISREQYWALASDSYTLAPNSEREISTTILAGLQRTSSTTEEVAKSINASASLGWGAFSASLSASLSASSSNFQQVQITEQTTSYESMRIVGADTGDPKLYLKWQLTDVITVFQTSKKPPSPPAPSGSGAHVEGLAPTTWIAIATIVSAQSPTIIDGPYDARSPHPSQSFFADILAR